MQRHQYNRPRAKESDGGSLLVDAHCNIIVLLVLLLAGCTSLKRCAYEGINRDQWQKPDKVIRSLGIRSGDRIADLGSGGGYFTFRLARARTKRQSLRRGCGQGNE